MRASQIRSQWGAATCSKNVVRSLDALVEASSFSATGRGLNFGAVEISELTSGQ